MRKYLATLHQKPEHHKKRFALLVSGTTTLFIFTIWCVAKFGTFGTTSVIATTPSQKDTSIEAMSPIQSIRASASEALSALGTELEKAKAGLESVDMQNSYTEVRNNALNQ
jgi:hypothetical protein